MTVLARTNFIFFDEMIKYHTHGKNKNASEYFRVLHTTKER